MRQKISEKLQNLFQSCVDYMMTDDNVINTSSVTHDGKAGQITEFYSARKSENSWNVYHIVDGTKMQCMNVAGIKNTINTDFETALTAILTLEQHMQGLSDEEFSDYLKNAPVPYDSNHIVTVIRRMDDEDTPEPPQPDTNAPSGPATGA